LTVIWTHIIFISGARRNWGWYCQWCRWCRWWWWWWLRWSSYWWRGRTIRGRRRRYTPWNRYNT